jgi:hypothetical protein
LRLDRALERSSAIDGIEPRFAQKIARRIVEFECDIAVG